MNNTNFIKINVGSHTATVGQLPDCERGRWYVIDCSKKGVAGLSGKTVKDIKDNIRLACAELSKLNRPCAHQ